MAGGTVRTRFAPSPTGPLHLGHAFAALTAADLADPGQFLLRIEDIDRSRCRPEWETAIFDDLRWLGLDWPQPVMRQSDRMSAYAAALARLSDMGLTYPCRCRRADIAAALSAPQEGAAQKLASHRASHGVGGVIGPDGLVYPGTCRGRAMRDAGPGDAIRLDMAAALRLLGLESVSFDERSSSNPPLMTAAQMIAGVGDVVLSRRDFATSYHLSVVVDDAAQGVTLVTRGEDLFGSTFIHAVLQMLLDLPWPRYLHHRLIRDNSGRRLAKRDDARAIALYRTEGATPEDLRTMIGLPPRSKPPRAGDEA